MRIFSCLLVAAFLCSPLLLTAQKKAAKTERAAIKAVINRFFEGMQKGDTLLLRSTCTASPMLQTFMADKSGQMKMVSAPFSDFVRQVGTPTQHTYEERIRFESIQLEQSLASVWTPYTFYLDGKVRHCGTNSFQLVKTAEGWKIQYIIDTRRKDCK